LQSLTREYLQMEDTYRLPNVEQIASRLPAPNVGSTERLLTALAGAALLGYAWKNGSKGLGLMSAALLARSATGYCPGYAAMGMNRTDTRRALTGDRGVHIREAVTINVPAERVYRFWRQLDRLPEVMPHLERVDELDTKRSRWTAKAFDQVPVTWNAEIINEVPFETIGWKTLPGESIQNAGSVTFKPVPGSNGTEVRVHLQYSAPGGKAASWLAKMAGEDPAKYTREGLLALKRRLEVENPGPSAPLH
jgi:uncharacterized membrane protein